MKRVFGTFLLTEKNNEYRGEYFNNYSTQFIEESIKVINSQNLFEGTFETEWIEKGQRCFADLTITLNDGIYNLNWTRVRKESVQQNVSFRGKGIIKEGKLLVVYQMI